jgi:hypothetical protein
LYALNPTTTKSSAVTRKQKNAIAEKETTAALVENVFRKNRFARSQMAGQLKQQSVQKANGKTNRKLRWSGTLSDTAVTIPTFRDASTVPVNLRHLFVETKNRNALANGPPKKTGLIGF